MRYVLRSFFALCSCSVHLLFSLKDVAGTASPRISGAVALLALGMLCFSPQVLAATDRSSYIPYDSIWNTPPDSSWVALDTVHQQIFTAWPTLDRIDVLSTTDYHLIKSITVPSPSSLDISPDGTTLAVSTTSAHIQFFNTATLAKTNDMVFPETVVNITAFLYTANGNALIRALQQVDNGRFGAPNIVGLTAYWNLSSNTYSSTSQTGDTAGTAYSGTGPLARSGDYSKIILGDTTGAGMIQIIDGNSGRILWTNDLISSSTLINPEDGAAYGVANKDGSRYAICVTPDGNQDLIILDSSFNPIYQDQGECRGMIFSGDGQSLYRLGSYGPINYTQVLDMSTFTPRNVPTYSSQEAQNFYAGQQTYWQAADNSGMVYGVSPVGAPLPGMSDSSAWIALDTTVATPPQTPSPNVPVQIVRVFDNIGSPQGGDTIRLLCSGVSVISSNTDYEEVAAGPISVTIGGVTATNVAVSISPPSPIFSLSIVTVTTPPGVAGLADVVLSMNGNSYTAAKSFQYANSRTIFPFATTPNFLLYDAFRNRVYAANKDHVEVIDVATKAVLTPLVPASGKLSSSQFAGLSLSPDGNRLYIADRGANLIHMLDLTSPGKGYSLNVGAGIGLNTPLSPGRVFELSNGKLLGSGTYVNSYGQADGLFVVNPATSTSDWARDVFGVPIPGFVWNTTNHGETALIDMNNIDIYQVNNIGLWNANSSSNIAPNSTRLNFLEGAANEDGTVIALGAPYPPPSLSENVFVGPEILDFNQDSVGFIEQSFDMAEGGGNPGMSLHPSGSLIYLASNLTGTDFPNPQPSVEIYDLHTLQPTASIVFPEAGVVSNSPFTDHMLTADSTGRTYFGVTKSGVTMIALNTIPLSIGNLQPAYVQPQTSPTITVRGSGFQTGAAVTIGGAQAATTYVDENTLTVQAPPLAPGWSDVTVTLPSGATYTTPALLQITGSQPAVTPSVSGFSPASALVLTATGDTESVTVLGSGFEADDTVEIGGLPVSSAYIDSGHIQATIPASVAGTAGSASVAVISPYAGTSNLLALPLLNPVPVLQSDPITVVPNGGISLQFSGTTFVAGSTIQWNGQNLPTQFTSGSTQSVLAQTNAGAQAGTATVTVFNPPPGGGVSNPISVDVSPAHPVLYLVALNTNSEASYYLFPFTLNFGNVSPNMSGTYDLWFFNHGTAAYVLSSIAVTPGPFSVESPQCPATPPGPATNCTPQVTFSPTDSNPASATLTITDNAPGSPHIVTLVGSGTPNLVPVVTLDNIQMLAQTTTAVVVGNAIVGGPSISATTWVEYGTDQTLSTFSQTPSTTFDGDRPVGISYVGDSISGLTPGTQYAARLVVQTAWGTGKSSIQSFFTSELVPSLTLATNTLSSTVTAGQTASYSLVVNGVGSGYSKNVTVTCSGAPQGATCTANPAQFAVAATGTNVTVTVTTTASTAAHTASASDGWNLAFGLLFGTGVIAFRKKLRRAGLLLCLAALAFTIASCGGGSGSSSGSGGGTGPGGSTTSTPPGTYPLTINATTEGTYSSVVVLLNVQ